MSTLRLVITRAMADSSRVREGYAHYDVRLDVPAEHSGVAEIRRFLRAHFVKWRFRGHHDDALLVVCELATNALLHGRGIPVVRVSGTPWRMRVEVSDDSVTMPAKRQAGVDGGYGLHLLESLSLKWGAYLRGGGKVVWCELGTVVEPAAF